MNIVVNASENMNVSVNVYDSVKMCHKCLELETELIKRHNMIEQDEYDPLSKSYSKLEQPCISHEIAMQLNKEIFQKENTYVNTTEPTFDQLFEVNNLKAQLKTKENTIKKLKAHIKRLSKPSTGMKKDKVNIDNSNAKTKKRWIFGKCMKDLSQRVTVENDSTRMRSCMSAAEKEKNKHVIAVAATTAAVAGVQAAVAVCLAAAIHVSLQHPAAVAVHTLRWCVDLLATAGIPLFSGQAGKNGLPPRFSPSIEVTCYVWLLLMTTYCIMELMELHDMMQVVVINCHSFHRLKARRALRALKGLVKFQSLFRGFLVRKRVAATLYSMQALLRAQLAVRYQLVVQPEICHGESTMASEITEVQTVFNQMEQSVEQYHIMNIVVNASENMNVSVNVYDSVKMCHKCLELETELIKRHNMIEQDEYDTLSKSYSKLEQPCISHEIAMQLNKEIFQKENTYVNTTEPTFDQLFEVNNLKAQLKTKENTIKKLKAHIKRVSKPSTSECVNGVTLVDSV
ncbi:retrovirus-related pol polyprotein from transposon TNT 1-94 [Tanacetum coccineum]